jgi:hypothetical protein
MIIRRFSTTPVAFAIIATYARLSDLKLQAAI